MRARGERRAGARAEGQPPEVQADEYGFPIIPVEEGLEEGEEKEEGEWDEHEFTQARATTALTTALGYLAKEVRNLKQPPTKREEGAVDMRKLTSQHLLDYPVLGDEEGLAKWALGFLDLIHPLGLGEQEKDNVFKKKLNARGGNVWRHIDPAQPFKARVLEWISQMTGRDVMVLQEEHDPLLLMQREGESGLAFIRRVMNTDLAVEKKGKDLVEHIRSKLLVGYRARLQYTAIDTLARLNHEVSICDAALLPAKAVHAFAGKSSKPYQGDCWTCGLPGHKSSECPSRSAPESASPSKRGKFTPRGGGARGRGGRGGKRGRGKGRGGGGRGGGQSHAAPFPKKATSQPQPQPQGKPGKEGKSNPKKGAKHLQAAVHTLEKELGPEVAATAGPSKSAKKRLKKKAKASGEASEGDKATSELVSRLDELDKRIAALKD